MIWHIVLLLVSPLAALIGRLTLDDRNREILALRQQVLIHQRHLGQPATAATGSEQLPPLWVSLLLMRRECRWV